MDSYCFVPKSLVFFANFTNHNFHSLPESAHFLFYINDPPMNILTSIANIYADDSAAYMCAFNNFDDLSLADGLSSGLALTAQFRKDELELFNTFKT